MSVHRNRTLGALGAAFGALIIASKLAAGGVVLGSGAYVKGQFFALGFAVLLFVVGIYYLVTGGPSQKSPRR